MHTHHDAKAMAKILKTECDQRGLKLSQSESLEIVAKQFGLKNWNILAAMVGKEDQPSENTLLPIPTSWISSGSAKHLYEMGVRENDGAVVIRRSVDLKPKLRDVFGTLMQTISAERYRGKRVRFKAELMVDAVLGSATIWMRVDNAKNERIAFSNLERKPMGGSLSGSHDWVQRSIVLPVADEAQTINFGLYLHGFGEMRARSLDFEIATHEEVITEDRLLPMEPQNLSFRTDRTA